MQSARRPHKILVVDDNQDAADTTADLLRLEDAYDVRVVYDGLQAVNEARVFGPEVVVLDINMPVMDGYQAAAVLRKEQDPGKNLVLVAVTGRTGSTDIEQARLAGFDHHLAKPLDGDKFVSLIASCIDSSSH